MKGWKFEPERHSLASKGIKTSQNRKKKIISEVRKKGLNPKKLNFFLTNIQKFYGNRIGTMGNCGVFAIGLKRFLEKKFDVDTELVGAINEYEPENFFHVALRWDDNYWDIDGKRNKIEVESHAQHFEYPEDAYTDVVEIDNEESVLSRTSNMLGKHDYNVEGMVDIFEREWKKMESEFE